MGTLIKALFSRSEKPRATIREIAVTTADGRTVVRTDALVKRKTFENKADELKAFAERVVKSSTSETQPQPLTR
jgi:hypothetical protein